MTDRTVILIIVILILLVSAWHLFLKDTYEGIEDDTTGKKITSTEKYLRMRLRELRQQADYSEGFMQALSKVSHIATVDDKIKDYDDRYEKLKTEEYRILKLLE